MNRKFIYIGCTALAMAFLNVRSVVAQEAQDSLVNVAVGKVAKEDLTHAVSTVNTSELSKILYNGNSLMGLNGMVGGYNGNIWGQGALVLVDGVPRSASNIRATEVESVSVLKDAAAVALYGSRASKGVILITTKRGKNAPMSIAVSYTHLVKQEFLKLECEKDLLSSLCFSLLEDKEGHIWMGTNNGLFEYDKKTLKMNHYGIEEGMPSNMVCGLGQSKNGDISVSYTHLDVYKRQDRFRRCHSL